MLTHIPDNRTAVATKTIRDITEQRPIPRGTRVGIEDYDQSGELFVVEWQDRIYLASPDELRP